MEVKSDMHTHTNFSDGSGTIRENVEKAREKGLEQIAISDHGPGSLTAGVRHENNFLEMREEIDKLNDKYKDIEILLAVEANIISTRGDIDIGSRIIEAVDMIHVGLHPLVIPKRVQDIWYLMGINMISNFITPLASTACEINTSALINAINKYPIYMITHPGLKLSVDTYQLGLSCYEHGVYLEVNAAHGMKLEEFVRHAVPTGVGFVISSDAHHPDEIGELSAGEEVLEQLEVPVDQIINARRIIS